jgi:hypothetical protein
MIQIVILSVFFGGLVVGAIIANARGALPDAEQLPAQDQARWARIARERGV